MACLLPIHETSTVRLYSPKPGRSTVFVGTFEHSLDDKGRAVLPSAFRGYLVEGGVAANLGDCIGVWTPDEFKNIANEWNSRVKQGQATLKFFRVFMASAAEVRPDSQGRISLPQHLRDQAGLGKDLVINGRFDRIEIWGADNWQNLTEDSETSLAEAVSELGI